MLTKWGIKKRKKILFGKKNCIGYVRRSLKRPFMKTFLLSDPVSKVNNKKTFNKN